MSGFIYRCFGGFVHTTPTFKYGPFDVPALKTHFPLLPYKPAEGKGKLVRELVEESTPLAWFTGLYMVGRDSSLELLERAEAVKNLPDEVKHAGFPVYMEIQKSTYEGSKGPPRLAPSLCKPKSFLSRDAVLFEPEVRKIPGVETPSEEGHIAAIVFHNIQGFTEDGSDIVPWDDGNQKTIEERLWLPPGGDLPDNYIVPSMREPHEAYNRHGLPNRTVTDKAEAIRAWMDRGFTETEFTETQGRSGLSVFTRGNSGLVAVKSWHGGGHGPLCVSLVTKPMEGPIRWYYSLSLEIAASGGATQGR